MKILCIGPAYPLRGGIAKFNETLALKLKAGGHEVIVFSYRLQYPSFLFPGKSQYTEDKMGPELKIIEELHSYNFLTWGKTARRIIGESPSLVIVSYWMPYFAVQMNFLLGKLRKRKIKTLLLAHNLIPHEKQPGTGWLTRNLLSRVNGLICLSESVRDDALAFREDIQNTVLPHPVYDGYGERTGREEALKRLKLDKEFRYILFFGLIREYKGLDLLLEAMALVKDPSLKLLVAGEFYDNSENYLSIVAKYKLEEKIIFSDGFIPESEVKWYFSASELVVQPYKRATQSGVTQIAYHFRLPMVVTRVGGLPEIVEDGKTGYVVDMNPTAIASAINNFFKDSVTPDFNKNLERKAKEYGWDSFTSKLTIFADSLL